MLEIMFKFMLLSMAQAQTQTSYTFYTINIMAILHRAKEWLNELKESLKNLENNFL